jgi:hypothetical protein
MTRSLRCVVCGARGRAPPEVADEPADTLCWLCGSHAGHMGALLGRTGG